MRPALGPVGPAPAARRFSVSLLLLRRIQDLGVALPVRRLRRGEFLYVQGESGDTVFLIESGWMKLVIPAYLGRDTVVDIESWGQLLGETSLAGGVRQESTVAISDCQLVVLPPDVLARAIRSEDMVYAWTAHLSERLRYQQEVIRQFVTMDSRTRLVARLAMLGDRLGPPGGGVTTLPRRLTLEDFAAIVGTTRSRVGKFINELEQMDLIERADDGLSFDARRLQAHVDALLQDH